MNKADGSQAHPANVRSRGMLDQGPAAGGSVQRCTGPMQHKGLSAFRDAKPIRTGLCGATGRHHWGWGPSRVQNGDRKTLDHRAEGEAEAVRSSSHVSSARTHSRFHAALRWTEEKPVLGTPAGRTHS